MASAARTAAACLEDAIADQELLFRTSVKAGYLLGTIQQAIGELERGQASYALETLRRANERFGND